jgi:NAD(P)H-dependent FMN reductase
VANIAIIIGSTRPNRFGAQAAEFIHRIAEKNKDHQYELVDLKDVDLPMLDAPVPPSMANREYPNPKVQAWSKIVDAADGFIFVTPEYNHGVPAALKNAVDSIAPEWENKPVAFVSYGAGAGGIRAVEAFRPTVAWLGMHDLKDFVAILNYWQFLDEKGLYQPTEEHIQDAKRVITRIGFWANIFKGARTQLAAAS